MNSNNPMNMPTRDEEGSQLAERFESVRLDDEVDEKLGFGKIQEGPKKEGWLVNMHPVSWPYFPPMYSTLSLPVDPSQRP